MRYSWACHVIACLSYTAGMVHCALQHVPGQMMKIRESSKPSTAGMSHAATLNGTCHGMHLNSATWARRLFYHGSEPMLFL